MSRFEKYVLRDGNADRRSWRERIGDGFRSGLRSFRLGPYSAKDPALASLFGGGPVSAGVTVSEATALAIPAVFCAVSTISADIASLPLVLLRRLSQGGKERFTTHNLYRLLHDEPNPEMTSFVFRQALMQHVLVTGNAFAEIVRDGTGRPTALWPLMPHHVSVVRDGSALRYRVSQPSGDLMLEPRDVLHLKGPSPDGLLGTNIVTALRESLGLTLAADKFAATYFSNGATMGGSITVSGVLPESSRQGLTKSFEQRHQGVDRAHKVLLLENGATYTPLQANLRQTQFTELRTHQIREVARIFKMPPSKLGDLADATFSNVEQMNIAYYVSCLRPWLEMIEQEFSAKLISSLERNQQLIEHVTEGFLRGDTEKRAAYYSQALAHGWMTVNEIRERENLPPVAGGDQPRVPMNTEPLRENSNAA